MPGGLGVWSECVCVGGGGCEGEGADDDGLSVVD